MKRGLESLNALSAEEAKAELLKCCGSTRWAQRLTARRPFDSVDELLEASDAIWWGLEASDWLEAFSHHPKIGERKAAPEAPPLAQRWSEEEQAATRSARQATLDALLRANLEYEERFGYIFIVCATGKTTEEMLALLEERLGNEPERELRVAAEEQRRITHLRLRKLLEQ